MGCFWKSIIEKFFSLIYLQIVLWKLGILTIIVLNINIDVTKLKLKLNK